MQHDILTRRAACVAQHAGLWCVVPEWLDTMVAAVNRGLLRGSGEFARLAAENEQVREALVGAAACKPSFYGKNAAEATTSNSTTFAVSDVRDKPRRPFQLDESGIAVIELVGPMMKGSSKVSENANTVDIRRALRAAVVDEEVQGILLVVDSPGGTVAGTAELAADVKAAAEAKPLRVHADDLMASAALWATAAAHRITASPTTEIGSVGTVLVVQDRSEKFATEGVKVHVISTGPNKGAGAPGAEVTDAQLEALTQRVVDLNAHFLAALSEGRRLKGAKLDAVTDGRVWIAERAQGLGLIDAVASMDEALGSFRRSLARASRQRSTRAALTDARLRASGG